MSKIKGYFDDFFTLVANIRKVSIQAVLSVRPGSHRSSGGYSLVNCWLDSCINMLMNSNKKELVFHPIKWLVVIEKVIKMLKTN